MAIDAKNRPAAAQGRPRGRPRTETDAAQRERILHIAWTLFAERGYGRTAMTDVAAGARMSLSTIYRFFASKTELFAAIVAQHRHTMLALPGDYDDLPLVEALMRIFHADLDVDAEARRRALITMFIAESRQYPELQPIFHDEGPGQSLALLSAWLEDQKIRGRIAVSNSRIAAKMLMDVAFGAPSLKDGPDPQWPGGDDRAVYLRHCFSMLARGIAPRHEIAGQS